MEVTVDSIICTTTPEFARNSTKFVSDVGSATKHLPTHIGTIFTILFLSAEILLGVCGNLGAFVALLKQKARWKVHHLLLANLCVIGFLNSAIVVPSLLKVVILIQFQHVPSPPALPCQIRYSGSLFFLVLNCLTIIVMCINRQDAVLYPLERRIYQSNRKRLVVTIWILSSLITAGHISIQIHEDVDNCVIISVRQSPSLLYLIVSFSIVFFTSIITIVITLVRIVRKLRSVRIAGTTKNRRNEYVITKLAYTTVFVFAACWIPLYMFDIIISRIDDEDSSIAKVKSLLLAISNLHYVINPFLHYKMLRTKEQRRVRHSCNVQVPQAMYELSVYVRK